MANLTFTDLPRADPLTGTEIFGADQGTGTDDTKGVLGSQLLTYVQTNIGPTASWPTLPAAIEAAWFEPFVTNGPKREIREASNGFVSRVLAFSGAATETASGVLTPDGWYSGTGFKFKIKVVPGPGASNGEILRLGVAARFSAGADDQDVVPPTFSYLDIPVVAEGQEITSVASAVLTPAGSPVEGAALQLWLRRDTSVGNNSLAQAEVRELIVELPQRTTAPTPF
jgi:hypothetical protein